MELVEVATHYSNTPDLLVDLRHTIETVTGTTVEDDESDVSVTAPADRSWHVRERLSSADIDQLVESFEAGSTILELVARYGIGQTSVKRLLRERGVRRRRRRSAPRARISR
jgi:hypothetical protein